MKTFKLLNIYLPLLGGVFFLILVFAPVLAPNEFILNVGPTTLAVLSSMFFIFSMMFLSRAASGQKALEELMKYEEDKLTFEQRYADDNIYNYE